MEIHQLRYLEAAVRLGSMVAAAAACHVSQPALSVQIRLLEEELGVSLLRREARGVRPTAAGNRVAETATLLQRELARLRREVKRIQSARDPVLRIGIQPYLASEILPHVSGGVKRWGGRLSVRERPHYRLVESLLAGEVDVAVTSLRQTPRTTVACSPLFEIGYGAFCPKDHPLSRRRSVRMEELLAWPLVLLQDSGDLEPRLLDIASAADRDLQVAFSSEQGISVFEMIASGLGVGLLPVCFRRRAERRGMRMVGLEDPPPPVRVSSLRRGKAVADEAVEALLASIRRAAVDAGAEMVADPVGEVAAPVLKPRRR